MTPSAEQTPEQSEEREALCMRVADLLAECDCAIEAMSALLSVMAAYLRGAPVADRMAWTDEAVLLLRQNVAESLG